MTSKRLTSNDRSFRLVTVDQLFARRGLSPEQRTFWRNVGRSAHGLEGELFATEADGLAKGDSWGEVLATCPSAVFDVIDNHDGQQVRVTTRIVEDEWAAGKGIFRWLSLLWRPRVERSLKCTFNQAVGPKKWTEEGLVGAFVPMACGELHHAAFLRFCNDALPQSGIHLTLVGPVHKRTT